jgi:hypothetical protein
VQALLGKDKALKNACKKTDYNCKIVVQKMELTTMKKAANTTTATITIKATTNAHPPQINNTDVAVDYFCRFIISILTRNLNVYEISLCGFIVQFTIIIDCFWFLMPLIMNLKQRAMRL